MRVDAEDPNGSRTVLPAFMRPSSLPGLIIPKRAFWSVSRRCMKTPDSLFYLGFHCYSLPFVTCRFRLSVYSHSSNRIVHSHGLSSTWCTAVSPFTGIRRFSDTQIELKMNSTPISGERLPTLAVNTEHHFYHHSPPSSFHVQLNFYDNHYGFQTLINGHTPRKNVFSPPVVFPCHVANRYLSNSKNSVSL